MIKCPYNEIQMLSGLLSAANKIEEFQGNTPSFDLFSALKDECPWMDEDERSFTVQCSDYHGVTPDVLVNSPNYILLQQEFQEFNMMRLIDAFKKTFNLTDKEAWAIAYEAIKKE